MSELSTLLGTRSRPKKLNRFVSVARWCFAPNRKDRIPFITSLGQTKAGRYLFCVVLAFPDGNGYPITARPMTDKEKRRFREWKNR